VGAEDRAGDVRQRAGCDEVKRAVRYTARGKRVLTKDRFTIPQRVAHPCLVVIWQTLNRRPDLTLKGVAQRSGVDVRTIRGWRYGKSPRLADVEAVLNAMNLRLRAESMLTNDIRAVS
jgi:hypothetical protein